MHNAIVKSFKREFLLSLLLVFSLTIIVFALPAPSSLNVNFNSDKNSAAVIWNLVPGAAAYNVYRKEAADPDYHKINAQPILGTNYTDSAITRGRDYLYAVKAVDLSGIESAYSLSAGGPRMLLNTQALVTTNRDKPLSARSIKTGKVVTFAAPGDIITYRLTYANLGCSSAKNININYAIPSGTVLASAPRVKKGAVAQISYFDRLKQKWLSQIEKEENISKVRFLIPEVIPPVKSNQETNGMIDLNVVITL